MMEIVGRSIILGSINANHILSLDAFLTPDEAVTSNHYQVTFGGREASQVIAAGRSGASVAFIVCTSNDDIGERIRRQLASDKIDVAPVRAIAGEATGAALIFINTESENVIGIHADADAALSVSQVRTKKRRVASVQALLMQLEPPLENVLMAMKIAHRHQTTVVLNPTPTRELSGELLALTDIITPNETEVEKLTGIRVENDEDAAKAVDVLHAKGIGTMMIILDSRGVWLSTKNESRWIPGFRIRTIDIIAASDTSDGALATALLEETSLPEAIRFMRTVAATAVTRKGMQPSMPWHTGINEFLM